MIAAADFAPWPVWSLVRREPRLEGLPLAVVAGTRVVAASPAARAAGVRVGMSADLARSKAGGLELRPLPPGLEAAWETLLHELNRYTPRLEAPHPGLVFLDLSPADARLLAGEYRVPVGLGPTREDARLAAATALPGEVRVVDDPEAFLEGFPVEHLAAVGLPEEGLARLRWLGIETAGQLAAWSRTQLLAFLPGAERILPYLKGPKTDRVAVFEPAPGCGVPSSSRSRSRPLTRPGRSTFSSGSSSLSSGSAPPGGSSSRSKPGECAFSPNAAPRNPSATGGGSGTTWRPRSGRPGPWPGRSSGSRPPLRAWTFPGFRRDSSTASLP